VYSPPGSVIEPASIRVIESEGMPVPSPHQRRTLYGNLYIKFTVKFPDKLTLEECEKMKTLLPPTQPLDIDRYTFVRGDERTSLTARCIVSCMYTYSSITI